jgi:hypothetical protein
MELGLVPSLIGGGWTGTSVGRQLESVIVRKDSRGNGGAYSYRVDNLTTWLEIDTPGKELYLRCGIRFGGGNGPGFIEFYSMSPSNVVGDTWMHNLWQIGGVMFDPSSRTLSTIMCPSLYFERRIVGATSAGTLDLDVWYLFEMRVCASVTEVKIDGVPFLSGPGAGLTGEVLDFGVDVLGTSHIHTVPDSFTALKLHYIGDGIGSCIMYFDDIAINIPYISYDNCVGSVPIVNPLGGPDAFTLTGTGGGVVGLDRPANANPATVHVYNWNGIPFADNEDVTIANDMGSFTAKINAPNALYVSGFLPNSLWPGDGHVVLLMPNAPGYWTGLASPGGANYANVNVIPPVDDTYNEATATGQFDSYSKPDLPSSAGNINAIEILGRIKGDIAGLQHYSMLLKYDGGADDFGTEGSSPTDTTVVTRILDVAPDGSKMTATKIDNSEIGIKFST